MKETVIFFCEPESFRGWRCFGEYGRLHDLLQVLQRKIIMGGEIHRGIDQAVFTIVMRITYKNLLTEIEILFVVGRRLNIDKFIVAFEPDGIGMAVLIFGHGNKTSGDAGLFVPHFPESFIQGLLSCKLIEPVVGVIVADQEDLSDILRYGGHSIFGGAVPYNAGLPVVGAICKHGGIFGNAVLAEGIDLLEGQQCCGQLYHTRRIEVPVLVYMEVVIPEIWLIVFIAIDLRIYELVLKGIWLIQYVQQEGRCLGSDHGIEPGVSLFLSQYRQGTTYEQ